MGILEQLADDKISSVRISVASTVHKHLENDGRLKNDPTIKRIYEKLSYEKKLLNLVK
jgi:hypothetical protein